MELYVEVKREYTNHLINIITPLLYEGLQSMYATARSSSNDDDELVLKHFQTYLKKNGENNFTDVIESEYERIKKCAKCEWIEDLLKGIVKINIIIFSLSFIRSKGDFELNKDYHQQIDFKDFLKKVYVECAREIWNNPYLFYHIYPPIEIKRNKRDVIDIIKRSVKESIRKILPLNKLVNDFLKYDFKFEDVYNNKQEMIQQSVKQFLNTDSIDQLKENKQNDENRSLNTQEKLEKAESINGSDETLSESESESTRNETDSDSKSKSKESNILDAIKKSPEQFHDKEHEKSLTDKLTEMIEKSVGNLKGNQTKMVGGDTSSYALVDDGNYEAIFGESSEV